uniref:Putative trypsin-like peptidase domain containing protein n=1 Tax=viral metagenome TaxID=1070528 RepID=A0A6M3JQW5_9ZZZZ
MSGKQLSREMLLPNVRVAAQKAGGSGTVIYSQQQEDGGDYSTYVLTNHHVIANNIDIKQKWSTLLKRDTKMDFLTSCDVHFFKYQYQSRAVGVTAIDADIVAYDPDQDLALLRLRDSDPAPAVAKMYPKGDETQLRLGMEVIAIGAGMGEPPVLTTGRLSQFAREIDNKEFWLSTAPTIFGNSGGALYLEDTEQLIGVPARIAVAMLGFGADAITHLSFAIPITRVYEFLDDQLFRFIYDSQFTERGEAEERDSKRKEEELKIAHKEILGAGSEEG